MYKVKNERSYHSANLGSTLTKNNFKVGDYNMLYM